MKKVYHIKVSSLTKIEKGEYIKYENKWKEVLDTDIEKGILTNRGWVERKECK